MSNLNSPRFVWYSGPESLSAGVISLLAVAETVTCVALYWLFWLKWGVTWQHWLIVTATPLVLMRSQASIKKGVEWFDAYWSEEPKSTDANLVIAALTILLTLGLTWFLALKWLTFLGKWPLLFQLYIVILMALIVLLAMGVAGRQSRKRTVAELVEHFGTRFTGIGVAGGIWFRAIMIRLAATFSHPLAGLMAIPSNWRKFIWHSDFCDPPELIPGHRDSGFPSLLSKAIERKYSEGLVLFFNFLPFYFLAFLWRWSIKSTAWFYLPLLWVGLGWQNIHGEDLLVWTKGYSQKWLNKVGMFFAAILLLSSIVSLIVPGYYFDLQRTLEDAGAPLPVIGWAFVLDWQSFAAQPWQWFYLPSWIMTLVLFFLLDNQAADISAGAEAEQRLPTLRRLMWFSNARTALTNVGLLIALFYFLTAVDAWGQVVALFS